MEKGRPTVAVGTYFTALWILGLLDGVESLASIATDRLGQELAEEDLPKRIRYSGARPRSTSSSRSTE